MKTLKVNKSLSQQIIKSIVIPKALASHRAFSKSLVISLVSCILCFASLPTNAQWTTGTNINNTNTGNVAIGTTNPVAKLQVNGNATQNPLRVQVNGSTKFIVYNNGGVSVGTLSPPATNGLKVSNGIQMGNSSSSVSGTMRWNGSNFQGYTGSVWKNLDALGAFTSASGITKINIASDDFLVGTSMTGIGTKMFFDAGKGAFRGGRLQFSPNSSNWDLYSLGTYSFAYGYNVKASGDNGATALGYYAIANGDDGATALGNFTTASGDDGATALGYATEAAGDESICIGSGHFSGNKLINNIDESLMIGFNSSVPTFFVGPSPTTTSTGNVGIATTNPTHDLHVAGDIAVAGQIVHPSDKNLKENIQDITNGLSTINQLSPKSYTHKADKAAEFGLSTKPQFGLIAQEVEKVLPEIVIQKALVGENGEIYKGLDYEKLIPILVAALQEEHAQKEALKAELTHAKSDIKNQSEKIEVLMNFMESQQSRPLKLSGLSGSK